MATLDCWKLHQGLIFLPVKLGVQLKNCTVDFVMLNTSKEKYKSQNWQRKQYSVKVEMICHLSEKVTNQREGLLCFDNGHLAAQHYFHIAIFTFFAVSTYERVNCLISFMKPLIVACVMMGFHSLRYQQLMPINLHYLLQKLRGVLSNLEKQVCPSAMYTVSYMR